MYKFYFYWFSFVLSMSVFSVILGTSRVHFAMFPLCALSTNVKICFFIIIPKKTLKFFSRTFLRCGSFAHFVFPFSFLRGFFWWLFISIHHATLHTSSHEFINVSDHKTVRRISFHVTNNISITNTFAQILYSNCTIR